MQITDIKIRRTYQDTRLRALVSVTIDGELAVHDIKVIEGPERLFVAMPSRRDDSGAFRDIAHPDHDRRPPPARGRDPLRLPGAPRGAAGAQQLESTCTPARKPGNEYRPAETRGGIFAVRGIC